MEETQTLTTTQNGVQNTTNGDTPAEETPGFDNPFDAIAYLLMVMRESLEGKREANGLPRYVRIVRPKSNDETQETWVSYIDDVTGYGVQGLNYIIAKFIDISLYGRNMLESLDAFVAFLEVSLETIGTATTTNFLESLKKSLTPPDLADNNEGQNATPVVDMNNVTGQMSAQWAADAQDFLKYTPGPEDLNRIGYELYLLSRVIYQKVKETDSSSVKDTLSVNDTGKLRFLAWAYEQPWNVYYPKDETDDFFQLKYLGQKSTIDRPETKVQVFHESGVRLYEASVSTASKPAINEGELNDVRNSDAYEAFQLLDALGYGNHIGGIPISGNPFGSSHPQVKFAIKWFQRENGLPQTAQLDNDTLNRLFNLDHQNKNIKWARRADGIPPDNDHVIGGYLSLQNGNADDYAKEQMQTKPGAVDYKFYLVGKKIDNWPENQSPNYVANAESAWKSPVEGETNGVKIVPGFVGVESRRVVQSRAINDSVYEGGYFSEGQASDGKFFFAARLSEPWKPGRSGQVGRDALWGTNIPTNGISRMYQDVPVSNSLLIGLSSQYSDGEKGDYIVRIQASAMFRSLLTDRTKSSGSNIYGVLRNGLSDQGRILLELLDKNKNRISKKGDDSNNFTTKWGPDRSVINSVKNARHIDQYNTWRQIYSTSVEFTLTEIEALALDTGQSYYVRVYLDGMWMSGYDIDAYFDDVKIRWDYIIPRETTSST